jgi:AICAR transformylase/IMP cyclohydrolase PurH
LFIRYLYVFSHICEIPYKECEWLRKISSLQTIYLEIVLTDKISSKAITCIRRKKRKHIMSIIEKGKNPKKDPPNYRWVEGGVLHENYNLTSWQKGNHISS